MTKQYFHVISKKTFLLVKTLDRSFPKYSSNFVSVLQSSTDLVDTDLVENFDLIDNLKKMQRPICGSLALQKLDLVENFDLVETIFGDQFFY